MNDLVNVKGKILERRMMRREEKGGEGRKRENEGKGEGEIISSFEVIRPLDY